MKKEMKINGLFVILMIALITLVSFYSGQQ
jgi:hypothetical protein